jgi:DNA-binding transcriptional ArsR family regulator
MPERILAAKELAQLLTLLSHPDRIRIIEELRAGEHDVLTLQQRLGLTHSRVSQHLALFRHHRLVSERREGRHVYYRLRQAELASWLLDGLDFVVGEFSQGPEVRDAVRASKRIWGRKPAEKS